MWLIESAEGDFAFYAKHRKFFRKGFSFPAKLCYDIRVTEKKSVAFVDFQIDSRRDDLKRINVPSGTLLHMAFLFGMMDSCMDTRTVIHKSL